MIQYKEPATNVAIYSPEELRTILNTVQKKGVELPPFDRMRRFARARVSELALLRWENINFARGFVIIASEKIRTMARRIVPMCDALRAWLLPYKRRAVQFVGMPILGEHFTVPCSVRSLY